MHFQFLLEDSSGEQLIDALMPKIVSDHPDVTYKCKAYHGIGGFTKKNTIKETHTGKLLNDLATALRGFNRSLKGIPAAVIVVMDNDDRNTSNFQSQIEQVAVDNGILVDHVFCIAVEEVEAWLLGDEAALLAAYPQTKQQALRSYTQDSICGTWEVLADVIYPGGYRKMKKDCPSYIEIGKQKSEWARKIGIHMNLSENHSPSFNLFISELNKRLPTTA